jgi:hypothetical protein
VPLLTYSSLPLTSRFPPHVPHSSHTHLTSLIRPHSTLCLINRFDYWLRAPPYEVRPSSTHTSPTHKLASRTHSSNLCFPHVDWERLTREVGTCLILKNRGPPLLPSTNHMLLRSMPTHSFHTPSLTYLPHVILTSFPYPSRLGLGSMPFH